jgi:hypothetical protein
MGVLSSIDRCLNTLPKDLLAEEVIYIELDKEKYDLLQTEITAYIGIENSLKFLEQKIEDFGTCSVLTYNGYKIIVALDSRIGKKNDTFYVAFRTQLI